MLGKVSSSLRLWFERNRLREDRVHEVSFCCEVREGKGESRPQE